MLPEIGGTNADLDRPKPMRSLGTYLTENEMNDIASSANCIRLTGRTTSEALEYIRRYAQENGGLVCAQVPAEHLPQEVQGVLKEVACICVTTPSELDESSELLAVNYFDVYNTGVPNLPGMATVCAVGGKIELDARMLSVIDALKSTFPVLFVHNASWAFVAYPWDSVDDNDLLQCSMMSTGENYRPFRDDFPVQETAKETKATDSKSQPSWYGHMYNVEELIKANQRPPRTPRAY